MSVTVDTNRLYPFTCPIGSPDPARRATCPQQVRVQATRGVANLELDEDQCACGGNDPSSGEGEIRFFERFTGRAVVNSVQQGEPDRMDVERIGNWVASDCGAVKPRTAGKP